MEFKQALTALQKTVNQNSPSILTAVAVSGVVSTAYLAAKGAFKASDVIAYEENRSDNLIDGRGYLTVKEKAKLTWKFYIPAAATGVSTIACVLGANSISSRRNAALISAYSLTENAFKEYKDKVVEQIGVNKEQKVRDEIAQDQLNANPVSSNQVFIANGAEVLCYETLTGRYFKSDMQTLRKAENDLNTTLFNDMYASLNDFFTLIGLPNTGMAEEIGWNIDRKLELQISTMMAENDEPCLCIGYRYLPKPDFTNLH